MLDRAEHGESIVVTRGGRRIAVIGPAPVFSGRAFKDLVSRGGLDEDFGRDVEQARDLLIEQESPWHDD